MTWYFWASVLLACLGSFGDIWTSRDMQNYNTREANSLMRNKYGYFSMNKQIIGLVVIFGLGFIAEYYTHQAFTMFLIIGIGRLIITYVNMQSKKKMREVQIKWLDPISKLSGEEQEMAGFFAGNNIGWRYVDGRLWYPLYGWITEENVPDVEHEKALASLRVQRRIWEFSRGPRTFPS